MPRLLPRLLRVSLDETFSFDIRNVRKRTKSLLKPSPPIPSFHPDNYPRSILLDSTNPITHSWHYVRHKSLPSRVYVPKRAKAKINEHDCPTEMSADERRWWANPYLRMLSSPLRRCTITNRYSPSDFLVRLGAVKLTTGNSTSAMLVPDGLQHTKITARRIGRSIYALCSRDAFNYVQERGQPLLRGQKAHPSLADYVAHLLRLRVLQELELLAEQLEYSSNGSGNLQHVLRRLTRREWKNIQETGIIPFSDAVAVLVVPPINKDPARSQRPEPIMSASPLPDDEEVRESTFPLSSLHLSQEIPDCLATNSHLNLLSSYQVPLYHGLALFPNKHQRAALYTSLLRILAIERRSSAVKKDRSESKPRARGDAKHSHAFLISSNSELARRGDVSATAIALWRVRMFESSCMGDDGEWTGCVQQESCT